MPGLKERSDAALETRPSRGILATCGLVSIGYLACFASSGSDVSIEEIKCLDFRFLGPVKTDAKR